MMKFNQTKLNIVLAMVMSASLLLAACGSANNSASSPEITNPAQQSSSQSSAGASNTNPKHDPFAFQQLMRKLWVDHVTWTRVYIIAALAELPEAETSANRLLQNQTDIGDAIKPFYGDQAGEQLTSLLRTHILIAADLLADAKAEDTAKYDADLQLWYDSADEIASFLNSANPDHWPLDDMQSMMRMHLDLTLEEAVARLEGNWAADVTAYDEVYDEILQMSDMLAMGIIDQFPNMFKKLKESQAEVDLTLAMSKLWEDHITWTRMYIMSVTSDLPDASAAAQRLLQNQVDIGNAIKTYYSDEGGDQLTALLNEHITIAVDLLAAAKAGDTPGFDAALALWYENADEIASFLNSANPKNWRLDEMQSMMKMHLDLTLEEANARFNGSWAADVAAYDKVHDEILEMSAILSSGIVAQFKDQFK